MARKNSEIVRQKICNLLARGNSLRDICASPDMPSLTTVFNWLTPGHSRHIPQFLTQYRVARMWQSESYMEQIIALSRNPDLPIDQKRIQIDALKIASAKLEGKKHGDDKPRQLIVKVVYESHTIPIQ